MDFEIQSRPDFSMLRVGLKQDEFLFAEPSAMATMNASILLKSGLRGGLFKSIGRMLGGESLVVNTFVAKQSGEVVFAPGQMGDIVAYTIAPECDLMLQRGAFLACTSNVQVNSKWGGVGGLLSGTGLVMLKAQGQGNVFFSTYGAMIEVDVRDHYYVDTGYIAAFESTLNYQVTALPGLGIGSRVKSFLLGGEGLVCRFSGHGKVWVQTRNVNTFLNWVYPFRPVRKRRGE
jgi:uncharacterized protein (TIGR00266 family)